MIVACVKWVSLRPDIDPLTGKTERDDRWSGLSLADQAAVEIALQLGNVRGSSVAVVTVGPVGAEGTLRSILACGVSRAVRIHNDGELDSVEVASVLADWARTETTDPIEFVVCGDWSVDRGSGSVPVFLAEALALDDACGLVGVHIESPNRLLAERRLDGGRREQLEVSVPALISVEGSASILRRANIGAVLASQDSTVDVVIPAASSLARSAIRTSAYRPRARVSEGPPQSLAPLRRIEQLTGALSQREPPRRINAEPSDAATLIIEQLISWGYLESAAEPV